MRGIAVLGVLMLHSTIFLNVFNLTIKSQTLNNFISLGRYGVALFFVVSAFSLARSLDLRKNDDITPTLNFYIRRFFRIAPAYYITIFIVYLTSAGATYYQDPQHPGVSILNLLSHLLFINGFYKFYLNSIIGVEWSVFIEILFYLCLPFIMTYFNSFKKILVFLLLTIVVSHITQKIGPIKDTALATWLYQSPMMWFVSFGVGVTLYEFSKFCYYKIIDKIKGLLFLAILISVYLITTKSSAYPIFHVNCIFVLLFLLFQGTKQNWYLNIFDNAIFRYFGKLSFSLYLVHIPILQWKGKCFYKQIQKHFTFFCRGKLRYTFDKRNIYFHNPIFIQLFLF
jgi:peptidoglycan/LPS O-acetylase OafA/YrhL